MKQLIFSTGNATKFANAKSICDNYDINLVQNNLEIDEIQSEDPERVINDKVQKAYDQLRKPVIVSDDSWEIPGLNGFPGAYMKSINSWFTPQDFANLTRSLTDRRVFLHSRLAYTDDGETVKLFLNSHEGYLLEEPRGNAGPPSQKVISMAGDNGLSIAEVYDQDLKNDDRDVHKAWKLFCEWHTT